MDYKTWKNTKDNTQSTTRERFETLQKEYGFHVIEENKGLYKCIVGGACNTQSCNNTYSKPFRAMNTTGPYCYTCIGIKKQIKYELLIQTHPKIADSIIEIMNNTRNLTIENLTGGMDIDVKCRCSEKCLRCNKYHEYVSRLQNRVSGSGCPICTNRKNCGCQNPDEFCCFCCKIIKQKKNRVKNYNWCTGVNYAVVKNMTEMLQHLYQ